VCPESTREKGLRGEIAARGYLVDHGFAILHTNYRTRRGEIDIVARQGGEIVFVEVKSAGSASFGDPLGWVPRWKQDRIVHASCVYLVRNGMEGAPVRYDVIAVDPSGAVNHVRDAFRPQTPFRV